MAKKLRKRPASPILLMIKLLIPWIVMVVIAASLSAADYSEVVVYSGALVGALLTTVAVYLAGNRWRMVFLLRRS